MQETDTLRLFLTRSLSRKQERYISFVEKPKTRPKFLKALYHDIADCFGPASDLSDIPDSLLDADAYVFQPPAGFGQPKSTLRELIQSHEEAFLAVTLDGKAGMYRQETMMDSQLFFLFIHPT